MITMKLFRAFDKRGLILKERTELEAVFEALDTFTSQAVDVRDVFLINDYEDTGDDIIFKVTRINNMQQYTITHNEVIMIDGMDPVRLACAYHIDENGDPTMFFVEKKTDVLTEIIGKNKVTIDGHVLKSGNRIVLKNDKTKDMTNVMFTVRFDGENKIKLARQRGRPKFAQSLDDIDDWDE